MPYQLVGYVYLLIPILETVQRLIAKEGFDIVTLGIYLKSVLTSIGIFYTKNVFDRLIARLKRNVPKDNEDVIKEHIERKDELRRVLNKYEGTQQKVSSIKDKLHKLEKQLESIQNNCSHKNKSIKFINLNEGVRWVCNECQATLQVPSTKDSLIMVH